MEDKSCDSMLSIDSNDSIYDDKSFIFQIATSADDQIIETQDPLRNATQPDQIEFCSTGYRPTITYNDNHNAVLIVPSDSLNLATMKPTESGSLDSSALLPVNNQFPTKSILENTSHENDGVCSMKFIDHSTTDVVQVKEELSDSEIGDDNTSFDHQPMAGIVQIKEELNNSGSLSPAISISTKPSLEEYSDKSDDGSSLIFLDNNTFFNHQPIECIVHVKEELNHSELKDENTTVESDVTCSENSDNDKAPLHNITPKHTFEIYNKEKNSEFATVANQISPKTSNINSTVESDESCSEIPNEDNAPLNNISPKPTLEICTTEDDSEFTTVTNQISSKTSHRNSTVESDVYISESSDDDNAPLNNSSIVQIKEILNDSEMLPIAYRISRKRFDKEEENVDSWPLSKRLKLDFSRQMSVIVLTTDNKNPSYAVQSKENYNDKEFPVEINEDRYDVNQLSVIDFTIEEQICEDMKSNSVLTIKPEKESSDSIPLVDSAESLVSSEVNVIQETFAKFPHRIQSSTNNFPIDDDDRPESVYAPDSDETDDSDREADDDRAEIIRQCDLELGSQRIQGDLISGSDTDDEPSAAERTLPEDIVLSGKHWEDECSQLMRHCGIGTSKTPNPVDDDCFLVPKLPLRSKSAPDQTLDDLLNKPDPVSSSPPMSSQLIDIEMAALAVEMATSEEDWLQLEQQQNQQEMDVINQAVGGAARKEAQNSVQQKPISKVVILNKKSHSRIYENYNDPLPLMIDDVLQLLKAPAPLKKPFTRFGLRFNTIAIYGRCIPLPQSSKGQSELRRLYEVDDGTASVTVTFEHFSKARTELYNEVQLVERNLRAQRNTLDKITYGHLRCLIQDIRANNRLPSERVFELGSNVLVIGRPFWSSFRESVQVRAYDMFEDGQRSRDLEIAFKMNMANMYETRYDFIDQGGINMPKQ